MSPPTAYGLRLFHHSPHHQNQLHKQHSGSVISLNSFLIAGCWALLLAVSGAECATQLLGLPRIASSSATSTAQRINLHSQDQYSALWSPSCLSWQGTLADWWSLIKLPAGNHTGLLDPQILATCPAASSGNASACWQLGGLVNDPSTSPLRLTLRSALDTKSKFTGFLLYNDAEPNGTEHFHSAHAKGVLAFGPGGGFWITHSFPRYPAVPGSSQDWDEVQRPQTVYGQHALCLSLQRNAIRAVLSGLLVAQPYVYASRLPALIAFLYPEAQSLASGKASQQRSANTSTLSVATRGGLLWQHIVKAPTFIAPFHEAVLEPQLQSPMLWETWIVGSSTIHSECAPSVEYDSLNVKHVQLHGSAGWRTLDDHSKWGVSPPLLCHSAEAAGNVQVHGTEHHLKPASHKHNSSAASMPQQGRLALAASRSANAQTAMRQHHQNPASSTYGAVAPHAAPIQLRQLGKMLLYGSSSSSLGCGSGDDASSNDAGVGSKDFLSAGAAAAAAGGGNGGGGGGAEAGGWLGGDTGMSSAVQRHALQPVAVHALSRSTAISPVSMYACQSATQPVHLCVGDLNRQRGQLVRGGGYACTQDRMLWAAFAGLIVDVETCQLSGTHAAAA